ncbi:MAG: hypothetical protein IKP26_07410 [Clostridia bacterium]|nr:hypothetical protein [Clostridia bacterium]
MKYTGKWRIKSCMTFDGDSGLVLKTLDEMLAADPADETAAQMRMTVIDITGDGRILTTMPIPEGTPKEAIEEAKASGMRIIDDSYALLESTEWKEENGEVKFDTGVKGEVLGESVDPWAPLKEDENGLLVYQLMRLERME